MPSNDDSTAGDPQPETCTFCGVTPSETIVAAGDRPGEFYDIPVCQTHWVDYQKAVDKQESLYG